MHCASCGKENIGTALFCNFCGARIQCPEPAKAKETVKPQQQTAPTPVDPAFETPPVLPPASRASRWWAGYVGCILVLGFILQQRYDLPTDPQPRSVTRPLGFLFELLGFCIPLVLIPAVPAALYFIAKAIIAKTLKPQVTAKGVAIFLAASAILLALLSWIGAGK